MRRSIMSCFVCALVIALLGTTGLYRNADAGLPDAGGLYASDCSEGAVVAMLPADEAGSGGKEEEQLPAYAQTLPQNGCTQCKDKKKVCCISGNCRTVSC